MRNAGANKQQQQKQQQQNELGHSRQRLFLTIPFFRFPITVSGAFVLCHLPSVSCYSHSAKEEFRENFMYLAFLANGSVNPVNYMFR